MKLKNKALHYFQLIENIKIKFKARVQKSLDISTPKNII